MTSVTILADFDFLEKIFPLPYVKLTRFVILWTGVIHYCPLTPFIYCLRVMKAPNGRWGVIRPFFNSYSLSVYICTHVAKYEVLTLKWLLLVW